jgi:hypothetical protein
MIRTFPEDYPVEGTHFMNLPLEMKFSAMEIIARTAIAGKQNAKHPIGISKFY